MFTTEYKRVSKKRPCRICGKPDWCSFTKTESISFCARSTFRSDRISPQGWGVYYHFEANPKNSVHHERSPSKIVRLGRVANLEIRNRVYRKLIELSLAALNDAIVYGKGGLQERGIQNISCYGSLPKKVADRDELVRSVSKELESDFGRGSNLFKEIPGFWKDRNSQIRLWSENDISDDLLLIPFNDKDGNILACQIRFMKYLPNKSGHYVWLSSVRKPYGSSPGSPLHHANPGHPNSKSVLVTEGALKAATVSHFLSDKYVVGNSGVTSSHSEIVEIARGKSLEIAFDNDSFTNPHVARALAGLIRRRRADQISFAYDDEVRILTWDMRFKGIDEALLAGARMKYLSVSKWLGALTNQSMIEAKHQLSLA